MIATPVTRYARSGDVRIAYQVTGDGPIDLVFAPGTFSHLDLAWERPASRLLIERLSSFSRLIRFDKRGTGLSDRPTAVATLEERTDDIRAVMDAAGSSQAAIFGASEGASMACLFAATYPERTRVLVIWGAQARWVRAPDYPWGMTPEANEQMIQDLAEHGVTVDYLLGPGMGLGSAANPALLELLMKHARASASPAAFVALERMNAQVDIRDILPTIRVPTLVMNRSNDPVASIDAARELASRIPGAHFLEFPGATHQMTGIEDAVFGAVEEFITGSRGPAAINRVLATILFVDIVGSTELASRMGDADWSDLLAWHDRLAEREIAAHGGTVVNRAGDGLVATFDGPGRAIRCSLAIRRTAQERGIRIRAGVHTGEVERRDAAISGVAMHTAARICALAGPAETLVSSTVKDLVAGSSFEFSDRGLHVLKGIEEPRQLYEVVRA
jgi:class 3 adenylate cyclase/pimeloyl-ACP methyl ester carboxylesterase